MLSMAQCIDVQEQAFRRIPDGGAIHRPRLDVYVPCERDDGYYRSGTMEGADDGILAIRMKTVLDRCHVKIRQGVGGLGLTESERVHSERGHSPMAYIAGTAEEMQRLPPKGKAGGFGGDYPDYCDLVTEGWPAASPTSRSPSTTTSGTRGCSSPA
jgi:hypothetical protein